MCGIAGFISQQRHTADYLLDHLKKMSDIIAHRGPDADGFWADEEAGVALAHRRLSIIDLSPSGAQPMLSANGRYVVSFNGEIYNFQHLRDELEKYEYPFKGTSDTEVAAAAFQYFGIEESLKRFVGMFAFAIWDRKERRLTLARDRAGEKPLYYGRVGPKFCFASELKSLCALPEWQPAINRNAVGVLMQHCYVTGPETIYEGVFRLPPGTYLTVSETETEYEPLPYWSVADVAINKSGERRKHHSPDQIVEGLHSVLFEAVERQMVSDVPLGAFLSGGIDSSTVVALMQAQSARKVNTYSIGFEEPEYNEAEHAKSVAAHLGTNHTELYVTPQQARDVIPNLPTIYDEPFADSSQIPTYLLSKLTRNHVTVALSGDGADELFAGYGRYAVGRQRMSMYESTPYWLRKAGAELVTRIPTKVYDFGLRAFGFMLPRRYSQHRRGVHVHRLANAWKKSSDYHVYRRLVSLWEEPSAIVKGINDPLILQQMQPLLRQVNDFTERMMLTDQHTYLPDDILVKVDRASMAESLEVRAPFLDHRVIEYAWNIPTEIRLRDNIGKWPLREVLYRYVPKHLVDRPKMGFGIPIDHWLRGDLRDWAESLLSERRLEEEGFFNPQPIREKWQQHLDGSSDWHYVLWPVLMFQAWYESTKL